MHYYFATVVSLTVNGERRPPTPYTIRAANSYEAEDKLQEWLGDPPVGIRRYEISIAEPIGYEDIDPGSAIGMSGRSDQ